MITLFRTSVLGSALALATFTLSACSGGGATSPVGIWGNPDSLGETYLEFTEDGRYSGTDGCNRVMGGWEAEGNGFAIAPMASTMMACPDIEVWLVDPAQVQINGETLIVLDSAGSELGQLAKR